MSAPGWRPVAERLLRVLRTNDAGDLARLYHPQLRFTVRTGGATLGRDAALDTFRQVWPLLADVTVEVVDLQGTDAGFVLQHVLTATGPGGSRLRLPTCMVIALRDGLIVGVDEYFDPAGVGSILDAVTA